MIYIISVSKSNNIGGRIHDPLTVGGEEVLLINDVF